MSIVIAQSQRIYYYVEMVMTLFMKYLRGSSRLALSSHAGDGEIKESRRTWNAQLSTTSRPHDVCESELGQIDLTILPCKIEIVQDAFFLKPLEHSLYTFH